MLKHDTESVLQKWIWPRQQRNFPKCYNGCPATL